MDATARVATSATQSAAYAADTAERAAVVAAPKQRPSLLDQAESWGVSAWGEVLKGAGEVDARVHARTGLQVAKKADAAAQATASAAQAAAVAARVAADESGAMELTERLAAEAQLSAIQAVADSGRAVEQQLAAQGFGSVGSLLVGAPARVPRDPGFATAAKGKDYLATGRGGLRGGAGGYVMGPRKLVVRLSGLLPG